MAFSLRSRSRSFSETIKYSFGVRSRPRIYWQQDRRFGWHDIFGLLLGRRIRLTHYPLFAPDKRRGKELVVLSADDFKRLTERPPAG